MKSLREVAGSLRTTAILLMVLSALLLVNVTLPQAAVDPERHALAVRSGPVARFALVTLGLGHVATSGIFVATLALFFANLSVVLADRVRNTVRRARFSPPTAARLEAFLAGAEGDAWARGRSAAEARAVLESLGYRTAQVDTAVWGIKHRMAPLGFPLFHASFFLMCAGAVMLYLTRSVVNVTAAEGQVVDASAGAVVRRAPALGLPELTVRVQRVDVKLEDGRPTDLAVAIAGPGADPGSGPALIARVNDPVVLGDLTILVDRAGIAPVLWLVDARGFALDRVVVPAANPRGFPTRLALGGADLEAVVQPIAVGRGFPERAALPTAPVQIRLRVGDAVAFDGALRPGEAAQVGDRWVKLDEVRYWAGLRIVRERGGGLLIAGFAVAVLGIIWRMAWYRREVAVVPEGERLRIVARAEFFPARARDEAETIARFVEAAGGGRA